MSTNNEIVIAFDLYGTLLSTESVAGQLAEYFGQEKAQSIATLWRRYQLEYTWRLNNIYQPFSTVTRSSLQHALADFSLTLPQEATDSVMRAYDALSAFPDVVPALKSLSSRSNILPVIFSNGTHSMVSNSIHHSRDLEPLSAIFEKIVTVEEVKKFKPAPEVYRYLAEQVGRADSMDEVWIVSSNPFDIVGARRVGMKGCWVDRQRSGWKDGLLEGLEGRPTVTVQGIEEVFDAVLNHEVEG
ncbi:MAG: hypothetical protein M1833_005064 [Piccolia ochrophora]|nr:MAG: hypothetical protein M1833_005064 [Piccolia ochrophora]